MGEFLGPAIRVHGRSLNPSIGALVARARCSEGFRGWLVVAMCLAFSACGAETQDSSKVPGPSTPASRFAQGSWWPILSAPLSVSSVLPSVWTGERMLVWGGGDREKV
jgi:hypothetical protein